MAAAAGPLQAFGQVHRALRDNEKKLSGFASDLRQQDERMEGATRKLNDSQRKLRTETTQMLADLEELVLQSYEEHEAKLAAEREASAKLRAELEAEQAAHRAALVAQQGQIDALAAALRRQQEVLDEHMSGAALQMNAVQAEAGELHRAFKAQGAAVQATKAFISSVDEKLCAMIDDRARASDAQFASATAHLHGAVADHHKQLERVLSWEPQMRANEENLRGWRVAVDEALGLLKDEQNASARSGAETAQTVETKLNGRIDSTSAEVIELRERLSEFVTDLRAELGAQCGLKASAADLEERCGALEATLISHARTLTPLAPEVQGMSGRMERLENASAEAAAQSGRTRREISDVARMLTEVSSQLNEAKSTARAHKQLIIRLEQMASQGASSTSDVEARLRQVASMCDEQSRWLTTVADALHTANIRVPKFRSSALALQPSFDMQSAAPPPPLPDHLLLESAGRELVATTDGRPAGSAGEASSERGRPQPAAGPLGHASSTPMQEAAVLAVRSAELSLLTASHEQQPESGLHEAPTAAPAAAASMSGQLAERAAALARSTPLDARPLLDSLTPAPGQGAGAVAPSPAESSPPGVE